MSKTTSQPTAYSITYRTQLIAYILSANGLHCVTYTEPELCAMNDTQLASAVEQVGQALAERVA